MMAWHTDNELSKIVMKAVTHRCHKSEHVSKFHHSKSEHVFYGILRGCGWGMKLCANQGNDYYYIDNGYFDAMYMDVNKQKHMEGKFRIVKNDMIEPYSGHCSMEKRPIKNIVILPPSPYSANFYDTTPEDWLDMVTQDFCGYNLSVVKKGAENLEQIIMASDAVIAFNSMAVMLAAKHDKAVYDTHGIFRNYHPDMPMFYYKEKDLREFYEPKQFTLQEIREGKSPL